MKSILNGNEAEQIVLEHILMVRQLEEETSEILEERRQHLVTRVLLRINEHLKNVRQIKTYDHLYYHVESLRLGYEAFLEEVETSMEEISDLVVIGIFKSIRENAEKFILSVPDKKDNPITYERMVLINSAVSRIKQHLESLMDEGPMDCRFSNQVTEDGLLNLMNRQVRLFFFKSMFTINHLLEESLGMLSDFDEGKKYEALIKGLIRDVSNLVLMQRDVIHAQLKTDHEKEVVNKLMERLEQMYRASVEIIEALEDSPMVHVGAADIINMEQVDELLKAHLFSGTEMLQPLLRKVVSLNDESTFALTALIDKEVTFSIGEIRHKMAEEAAGFLLLSNELLTLFVDTNEKLSSLGTQSNYVTEIGRAIAEGITETMALKLESIKEKDTAIRTAFNNQAQAQEEVFSELKDKVLKQSGSILEDILENRELTLDRVQKQYRDGVEVIVSRQFKTFMGYMKNDLLFELRTFEELIEHSLKKLIELEPGNAAGMTAIMLGTMERSRNTLATHDIKLIIPKAHDKFDARRHEVVLAEPLEGYEKGVVIKTINIGYQLKDYVIIRASVMAAR